MYSLTNKVVMVTGCSGTVGSELIKQLLSDPAERPAEVLGIDINETALFFQDQEYLSDNRARFFLLDVRDSEVLIQHTRHVDVIFHAAALKHVVMCERSPFEAVKTNIQGTENVIRAANVNNVSMVILTSSDKAVNPTSVMGTSKLMSERLITAANSNRKGKGPIFSSTRFGNILGSNGSVISIFTQQIMRGGPVTVTDPDMTRFIMSIEQSAKMVLEASRLARGGEVLITKMPVIKIIDLAYVMIDELAPLHGRDPQGIKIIISGMKSGEKRFEELMSDEEIRRSWELPAYFCVVPAFKGIYHDIDYSYPGVEVLPVTESYKSSTQTALTREALKKFLIRESLLTHTEKKLPGERYWPGDKEERAE
jgi:FlaA1/EpsC-like NDP-sugar epimerase